jgi:exosortase A-associated hydrolase 2
MSETPFFFPRGDIRLFGVLHRPAGTRPRSGFVLSHPFAEEKLWSHRVFVSMARALAARGHAVLRFDYTGAGDSEGTTLDTSVETHLADLGAAIRALAERESALETIGLAGLRLGATFAALTMERAADGSLPAALRAGPLVLWEPVVDGAAYIQDVMRSNLSAQLASFGKVIETREVLQQRILAGGSVNIDGYELGRDLFQSCHRSDLLPTSPKTHGGPTLITPIAPARKQKPRADLEALAATYAHSRVRPADEEPFWREIKQFYGRAERLQTLTLDWLEGARD